MKFFHTLALLVIAGSLGAQDWSAALTKSETFRTLNSEGFSMDYALREEGSDRTSTMRVFIKAGDPLTVAVKYLSPPRYEDRRILVTPEGFWLMDRGMRSPLRISPQQMLFGEAAAGDLTRISFSLQYSVLQGSLEGGTVVLTLEKKPDALVSFPRVVLTLDEGSYRPRSARFFTASGQLSKTIHYEDFETFANLGGRELMTGFRIVNELSRKETLVRLGAYTRVTLPAASFTRTGFGRIP